MYVAYKIGCWIHKGMDTSVDFARCHPYLRMDILEEMMQYLLLWQYNGLWFLCFQRDVFHPNASLDGQRCNTKTFIPHHANLFFSRPTNLIYLSCIEIQSPTPSRCFAAPCLRSKLNYRPQKNSPGKQHEAQNQAKIAHQAIIPGFWSRILPNNQALHLFTMFSLKQINGAFLHLSGTWNEEIWRELLRTSHIHTGLVSCICFPVSFTSWIWMTLQIGSSF